MPTFDLTPGEALVLLEPNKRQGKEALKVSLTWLLAKRCLSISQEHKPGFFGRFSQQSRLRPSGRLPDRLPAEMTALLEVAKKAGFMDQFVREARFRYGPGFNEFQKRYLVASLLKRGLVERRTDRFLFVFRRTRLQRTPSGEAMRQRIDTLFASARGIPGLLDSNPAQAAALAATLGGLIFLVPELKPCMNEVALAMRRPAYADGAAGGGIEGGSPLSDAPTSDDTLMLDFAGLDTGALDAIDTGMAAFDSSSAGSGGDGGGGDGGGGGGGGD